MNAKTAPLDDRPLRTEPIRPTGDAGDGWGRAAAYDAYADGLHTYAIWSLRDHDAAVDALYCTFVLADHHITQLRQPDHIQPWLYSIMRRECVLRASLGESVDASESAASSASDGLGDAGGGVVGVGGSPSPVSGRLRPPDGSADPSGSLASLERNLRRAEFHSLEWPESEGLAPAHREILELTIRHGLDSQGLGLVLGLGQSGRLRRGGAGEVDGGIGGIGVAGSVGSQGFGVLADAWRELERSLAAVAVAKASREHCAQLAELTFGWSGRLTAALRAPLTDHVDGCTRCQHYLHTVIGTPAAPTILPFVAAPRALREILLGELHDPRIALRLGIDHEAIASRVARFAPNGFPVAGEPAPLRRRGGRRTAPKENVVVARRKSAATREAAVSQEAVTAPSEAVLETTAPDTTVLPRRTPGASMRSVGTSEGGRRDDVARARVNADGDADGGGVYRVPGSWAARVLPAENLSADAVTADRMTVWRPTGERRGASSGGFISTPSGRFASRVPNDGDAAAFGARAAGVKAVGAKAAGAEAVGTSGVSAATDAAPTARVAREPRLAVPDAEPPRDAGGRPPRPPSARHKSRPMRQAVLSAVALGAVGAAAATAAALLGAATNSGNSSHSLSDIAPPQDPVNTPVAGGGLSVSVSTPAAPGASSGVGAHASKQSGVGGSGPTQGSGATGISGTVRDTAGAGAGGGGPSGQGVNAADFKVSINQRDADPDSVTILLRNIGGVSIAWSAVAHDSWITLSQRSGTLAAGRSVAIIATATSAAPAGAWTSTVTFAPGGAVVTLHGVNGPTPGPTSSTGASATPSPSAATGSASPSSSATPGPTPTPTASASSNGVGPSTAGPSRSVPASVPASTSMSPAPSRSASATGSSPASSASRVHGA